MSFTYTLSENGQVLKPGKADLKDMDYQERGGAQPLLRHRVAAP
ncbi:hypothetical protein ACU4GR_04690 [Methylobacterium oryzae CBMB20]